MTDNQENINSNQETNMQDLSRESDLWEQRQGEIKKLINEALISFEGRFINKLAETNIEKDEEIEDLDF